MPLYMDIHHLKGISLDELEHAHVADTEAQARHGVHYLKYWFNERTGSVCCLVDAPDPDAALAVHREAHGLMPDAIIQVDPLVAEQFLGNPTEDQVKGAAVVPGTNGRELDGGFRTILFTDLADSTAFTQRVGDDEAVSLLRIHNAILRDALARWKGREVKHTGDGIMAAFLSASAAVRCAIEIQRAVDAHNRSDPIHRMQVRIGASAGEPVEDDRDLFGASVQLAARTCARAEPGQILVSNVVAELCIGKGFRFEDRGETELKGFAQPVRLHAVDWQAA